MRLSEHEVKTLLCYFGHHKCASTWVIGILYDVNAAIGLRSYEKQIVLMTNPHETIVEQNPDFYICQTSAYDKVVELPAFKGFHLIRDPRDIIISGYYSHLFSHGVKDWPELSDHRKKLEKLDKASGLLLEIAFSKQFIGDIGRWNYNTNNVFEIKYETLIENPVEEFISIFKFLGLYDENRVGRLSRMFWVINKVLGKMGLKSFSKKMKVDSWLVNKLLQKHSFDRLSGGRKRGQLDLHSHYRKGIAGDWKNHFEDVHKERFKEVYGDILITLEYEQDNSW